MSALITILCSGCAKEPDRPETLSIGLVSNSLDGMRNFGGFKTGLANVGYLEGERVIFLQSDSPTGGQALSEYIDMLVEEKVDLIFAADTLTGIAAFEHTAGTDIPVVFGAMADPIAAGVMTDLTEPGGNITGVMLSQNQRRRLAMLIEIDPNIRSIYLPHNPDDPAPVNAIGQITQLAGRLGITLVEGHARDRDEALALIESIPDSIDAIFLLPDTTVNPLISKIVRLANQRKIPLSGPSMFHIGNGALTAYGVNHTDVGIQAACFADQVLSGTDPGVIPVEVAEFALGINLHTAETIGIEIPPHIIQQSSFIVHSERQE